MALVTKFVMNLKSFNMSSIVPTLSLYVDNGQTPYYWMDVEVASSEGYEIVSHGTVPAEADGDGEVHIDVNLQTLSSGPTTIEVILAEITIDPEQGEIHIHLLDDQQTEVGGGVILTEAASEKTRPIGPIV
jgi:hypothetical protein